MGLNAALLTHGAASPTVCGNGQRVGVQTRGQAGPDGAAGGLMGWTVRALLETLGSPPLTVASFVGLGLYAVVMACHGRRRAYRVTMSTIALGATLWLLLALWRAIPGPLGGWSALALAMLAVLLTDDDTDDVEIRNTAQTGDRDVPQAAESLPAL